MKKIKSNIDEIIYIIALFIVSLTTLSSISDLIFINDEIRDILNATAIILFLIKILKTKYTLKEIIILILIGVICLISYFKLKLSLFIFLGLGIIAIKNININKVLLADTCLKGIFLLIHIGAFIFDLIGILDLNEIIRFEFGVLRHSIFLRTPHNFMAILFWIIIEINYLLKGKRKVVFISNLLFFVLSIGLFKLTYAKTPFFMIVMYFAFEVVFYFFKDKKFLNIMIDILSKYLFIILSIIWLALIICSAKYGVEGNILTAKIDDLLNTRLSLSTNAYEKYGLTFISNNVELDYDKNMTFIDSLYPMLFIKYGIIYMFVISLAFNKLQILDYYEEKIMIIMFSIYAFSEHFMFNIGMCPLLLVVASMYLNKNNGETMYLWKLKKIVCKRR